MKQPNKKLVLDSGEEFLGYGFGADTQSVCEIVFNTSMAGYQEILSNPSCTDQIVVMTYPMIGNYGITDEDFEARNLTVGGLIVREVCEEPSNFRFTKTLAELMEEYSIPGISGVDTRMLTRIIREKSGCRAAIVPASMSKEEALALIAATPVKRDAVERVSCKKRWYSRTANHRFDVVMIDCGAKLNLVRMLNKRGCNVVIVPFNTPLKHILNFNPDGILVSNGPGNPADVEVVVEHIKALKGKLPIFGVELGHQLIALAYGAKVAKVEGVHRGGEHPVRNLENGKIEITSQGSHFFVDEASLADTPLTVTHRSVIAGTVEGVECREDKTFSVQYNPESAPGAHDSAYLFDKFIKLMEERENA
ncbi:MAG: glutamine-hydrolyzing carbamoyl-phosphate synthase small subunit [Alistipes sp.]|nr:glutamine-hydrolyzing carbamoyl-phosphate synthase small subunit [Alistipes sp.]